MERRALDYDLTNSLYIDPVAFCFDRWVIVMVVGTLPVFDFLTFLVAFIYWICPTRNMLVVSLYDELYNTQSQFYP